MSSSRDRNSHLPQAALADYLQDLLPGIGAEPYPPETETPAPAHSRSEPADGTQTEPALRASRAREKSRPALPEWAEPPVLDPRVFTPQVQPLAEVSPAITRAPLETRPEPAVDRAPAPRPPAARVVQPEPRVETPVQTVSAAIAESENDSALVTQRRGWQQGRPQWAQEGFDCLLFSVSGLKLAVPLVLLGAVHPLDRELTPLVGRPKWFMGLLPRGDHNTRVVDTARWVMPDRYRAEARMGYGFVIRLDDSEWGLACDEVAQSFRLNPDEVKWRSEESRRPWLAGTVKSQMCALLDVGAFARMLAEAEKTQRLDLQA